ncbi:vitamin K epoxide reductase family protein [Candidatus Berkelbacteria bacterium]|nr:vitamin K epoxide reductase family protein [Candidatus Berkelbacteria bacterium]
MKTVIGLLALLGLADASYLTFEHYLNQIPPCTINGCEQVLTSQYATLGGVPIALFGVFFYLMILILSRFESRRSSLALAVISSIGVMTSAGLVYLQVDVIQALCLYCLTSAIITTMIWGLSIAKIQKESYVT